MPQHWDKLCSFSAFLAGGTVSIKFHCEGGLKYISGAISNSIHTGWGGGGKGRYWHVVLWTFSTQVCGQCSRRDLIVTSCFLMTCNTVQQQLIDSLYLTPRLLQMSVAYQGETQIVGSQVRVCFNAVRVTDHCMFEDHLGAGVGGRRGSQTRSSVYREGKR